MVSAVPTTPHSRPPRVCEVLAAVGAVRAGHPGTAWQVGERQLLVVACRDTSPAGSCLCGRAPEVLVVLDGRDGGTAVPACTRCAERVVEAAVRELHTRGRCAHGVASRPGPARLAVDQARVVGLQ